MSLADALSVAGFIIALIGIWQVWREARKAVSASELAATAAKRTQSQLQANQLLVLVPQLRWLFTELESAMREKDSKHASKILHTWRWQASSVRGILIASGLDVTEILTSIQRSVTLAATATDKLLEDGHDVIAMSKPARRSIGLVCDELTVWSERTAMTSDMKGVT